MDPFKSKYDKNGNGIDVPVQARVSNWVALLKLQISGELNNRKVYK